MLKTVLIVADDLGFAFWLGQALDRVGCQTWPARSVAAAESLVAELKLSVDLLVITASLYQAPVFATRLSRGTEDFKVIAVYDRSEEHTSELQSLRHLVCRLLLEKKQLNSVQTTSLWGSVCWMRSDEHTPEL